MIHSDKLFIAEPDVNSLFTNFLTKFGSCHEKFDVWPRPLYKTFLVKMSFICVRIRNHFHVNGFALSLAWKQRLRTTGKGPRMVLLRLSLAFPVSSPSAGIVFLLVE